MNAQEFRQEIETSVVELLNARIEEGSITKERAEEISQHVLDTLKTDMSFEELLGVIPSLDDRAPELSPVILPILREYESTVARKGEANVRELIRLGQYDAAVKLAHDVINHHVGPTWVGEGKPEQ